MSLIRPTFMGFETAKRSLEVNQKAIDIVANNLSNVDTPGYTRQRLDVATIVPSAYAARVSSSKIGVLGQGVEALGVGQIRDVFLDKRFRDEYAKASYHNQAATLLNDLQAALGDGHDLTDETALLGSIMKIFQALHDYDYEPTLESQSNIVLAAVRNFTQVMQQLDVKVRDVASAQIHEIGLDVNRVNEIFNEIAYYNYLISRDTTVMADPNNEYFRPNELLDKRNLALDELAGYGDISVRTLANGMIDVDFAGQTAVKGEEYLTMRMDVRDDQTISLVWQHSNQELNLSAGSLKASRDFMNGRGRNIQNNYETIYEGIPYYKDKLDTISQAFANLFNNTIPVRAHPDEPGNNEFLTDADGNVVYKKLIGAALSEDVVLDADLELADGSIVAAGTLLRAGTAWPGGGGLITAGNITISKEWADNGPGYFIFSPYENKANYAQQLCNGLTSDKQKFITHGEIFEGTFEDFIADYITNLASQIKFQEGRFESTALMADDFLDRRDEISGVNRDEETANMLIFQKSYNAAARLITTYDEMIDLIVNRMGIVGR